MSTLNEIKSTLDSALGKSTWWQRFMGSQFASYLVVFLAQVVKRCEQVASRSLQNSFLSTATTRAAILAGAEDRGYVGRKISPSTGTATLTNKTDGTTSIPQYSALVSKGQVSYLTREAVRLMPGESADVEIVQAERYPYEVTAESASSWYSVLFSTELTERTHEVEVYVNGELWEKTFQFRNTKSDSKAYVEYYRSTDQLGVRFGNGTNGKAIEQGDVITFMLWLTEGDTTLLNDQSLNFVNDDEYLNESVSVVTSTSIMGGDEAESIEEIRSGALYLPSYDNQLVWDSDFKAYIENNVGGLVWLSVWGEAEQEELDGSPNVSNINAVFISCYAPNKTATVDAEILALLNDRPGYNEKFVTASRVDKPFTVSITGQVQADAVPEEVQNQVIDLLKETYGKDVEGKEAGIYEKDIWKTIEENLNSLGIISFKVAVSNLEENRAVNMYCYLDSKNSTAAFSY